MNRIMSFFKAYWRIFLYFGIIMLLIWIAFLLHIDRRVIAFSVIIIGFITQLFTEMLGIIALIPILGPVLVKVISLPFIIIINGLGYIVTFFAFRKGYKVEVAKSKMFTTAMLIGVVLGFILGKLL